MDFVLNPDRERFQLTLVMALLVNGRTVLEDFAWAAGVERFANALKEFGLDYVQQGHQLVLTGKGFQYDLPSLLPIDFDEECNVMLWTLASKDVEQIYTFAAEADDAGIAQVASAKETLQKYFKVKAVSDEPAKFTFTFGYDEPSIKKDSLGNVAYIMRNRLLLRGLLRSDYITFEEKSTVHDQWTKMLMYFGVKMKYEGRGMEQLSELERRMMIARGQKVERTQFTEMAETKVITAREYYVPGDATEALAFALLTTISSLPKTAKVCVKNVDLNSSRAGALTCFKRMGASFETVSRRERYGDVYGDIEMFPLNPGKRLQGRRFSEDAIATGVKDYPFLAVAACFAEGETILRLPKECRKELRPINDALAENLRKTGAEVGVYDDGLVIRGLETVVNGSDFDGGEIPEIGLALSVLSIALENDEPVAHREVVEKRFPGILEKLNQVMNLKNEKQESEEK
ncbi:3-phosphoshikimate 1-carboxyvinyltransferase [Fibrobacter sp. UWEL]|uniref:3-phosphoshikimate 1-carboxyvinyltransferase n=1 Tax=Fibrobacter sp. UWEL TaxID=1896209 RepID=UPI000919550B|nr:3-phosphoshikimate 1-carboxyvinyltransferase [Fibrobacter sp. UWEL]SHL05557.1 3-phosphoshikimate 1-carboxyvinyltransferase [Fibrobacter sp. UWEL]